MDGGFYLAGPNFHSLARFELFRAPEFFYAIELSAGVVGNRWLPFRTFDPGVGPRAAVIALWLPTVVLAVPPLCLMRRYRRRQAPGLCPTCGYDLRATPDRCPECGLTAHA
jgi:hypothetical protein